MDSRSERMKNLIKKSNLSYGELSKQTGIPKSTLQQYATGKTQKIPIERIEVIAAATCGTPEYIMGWENAEPQIRTAAEKAIIYPITYLDNMSEISRFTGETQEVPASLICGEPTDYLVTTITDNAMYPYLMREDRVLIKRNDSIKEECLNVFMVNEQYLIRKIKKKSEKSALLIPINPEYCFQCLSGKEYENIKIIGQIIYLFRQTDFF